MEAQLKKLFICCYIRSNVPIQQTPLPQKNVVFCSVFWQWIFAYFWLKCRTSLRPKCAENYFALNSSEQKLLKSCLFSRNSQPFLRKPKYEKISLKAFRRRRWNFLRLLIPNLINCTTKSFQLLNDNKLKNFYVNFPISFKIAGVKYFFLIRKTFCVFFSFFIVVIAWWR